MTTRAPEVLVTWNILCVPNNATPISLAGWAPWIVIDNFSKPITIRDLLNRHNGQSCVLFFNPHIDVIFLMIFPHQITYCEIGTQWICPQEFEQKLSNCFLSSGVHYYRYLTQTSAILPIKFAWLFLFAIIFLKWFYFCSFIFTSMFLTAK